MIPSETLSKFITRRKLTSVPLDSLAEELAAFEAWKVIVAEQAA